MVCGQIRSCFTVARLEVHTSGLWRYQAGMEKRTAGRALKRPWQYNWWRLFQDANNTWQPLQSGTPQTVANIWRLAYSYRHAFYGRRWPLLQQKMFALGHREEFKSVVCLFECINCSMTAVAAAGTCL